MQPWAEPRRLARRRRDCGSRVLQFRSGKLIVFVIRALPRCHYSFMLEESIMTTSSFVGGGS
jgi:hypothetical protein